MSETGELVAGRYRLEDVLGRGGMGVVWRAVDTLIERTVALKELRAPRGDESSFVERALREARNAGRLNHPGVVAVHDVVAPTGDDDAVYIVMEYVEAPSLAEVIDRQGALPPARVAVMGLGILDALIAAHAMGVVHRDIKPGNVLVGEGDRVKLTDFGIALAAEDTRLTRTGVIGTHAYLAPECFDDGQVGPATDLWALGATLFHAAAGRPPYERATTTATLRAILFEQPPPPPCGPPLADAITGLLTRPVDQRLTSGAARELLQQAASTMPTVDAPPPPDPGRATWHGQSTSLHHAPTPPPPPAPPWAQPTQPGDPAPSYPTNRPAQPPQPLPARPPPPLPPTGPPSGPMPVGPPPARRNNTPLVLGGVLVAAALLVVVFLVSSGGGSDSDDGGGGEQSGGTGSVLEENPTTGEDPASDESTVAEGDPAVVGGQAIAREFLDLVQSGDSDAAIAMLCPVGDTQEDADAIRDVAGNADLELDMSTAEVVSQGVVLSVDLTGSVHGEPVSYAHVGTAARDDCIVTFSADAN